MMWGRARENGIWLARKKRVRLCWRGHDSLFLAVGYMRLRLMKPWRPT